MFLTEVGYLDLGLDMVTGLWYTCDSNFGYLSWFWRCKVQPCPSSPHLGLWRTLEFLTEVWHPDIDLDMVTGLWYTHVQNFSSLSWFWRCKEHPCPLSPHLGLWRMLEVPDWGFASWYWFGYGHWSLVHPYSEFWPSILILMVQRTSMSFKSWSWALEDTGGSWLGVGILIMI